MRILRGLLSKICENTHKSGYFKVFLETIPNPVSPRSAHLGKRWCILRPCCLLAVLKGRFSMKYIFKSWFLRENLALSLLFLGSPHIPASLWWPFQPMLLHVSTPISITKRFDMNRPQYSCHFLKVQQFTYKSTLKKLSPCKGKIQYFQLEFVFTKE